jgi:hypothetical protein
MRATRIPSMVSLTTATTNEKKLSTMLEAAVVLGHSCCRLPRYYQCRHTNRG